MKRGKTLFIIAIAVTICLFGSIAMCSCVKKQDDQLPVDDIDKQDDRSPFDDIDLTYVAKEDVQYADYFELYRYEEGYHLVVTYGQKTSDHTRILDKRVLVVPNGKSAPSNLPSDVIVVTAGEGEYLIGSAPAMALAAAAGGIGQVTMTTDSTSKWFIDSVNEALTSGAMTKVGNEKDNTLDYERIVAKKPVLTIWSAMMDMVYQESARQLTQLGIAYLSDNSSYEEHPLGRVEWIKLYGALFGKDEAAARIFDAQKKVVESAVEKSSLIQEEDKKTVLLCDFSSNGGNILYRVRREDDYVSEMVKTAGGKYVALDAYDAGASYNEVTQEVFYVMAKDADVIVWLPMLSSRKRTIEEFQTRMGSGIDVKSLKAYQNGAMWACTPDFYQITDRTGDMIGDLYRAFYGGASQSLSYLVKLGKLD